MDDRWINGKAERWISSQMNGQTDELIDGRSMMDGFMDGWMTDGWMVRLMGGLVDRLMHAWMHGWMYE